MIVFAQGNVADYCRDHDMVIAGEYDGEIEDYKGNCPILVTDRIQDTNEYYYLKYKLLRKKVELISVHHNNEELLDFIRYMRGREQPDKNRGRVKFGFRRINGEVVEIPEMIAVARKIFELRDSGHTYGQIQNHPEVHHPDGRKLSVSTIQGILKNRGEYDG